MAKTFDICIRGAGVVETINGIIMVQCLDMKDLKKEDLENFTNLVVKYLE